TRTAPPVLPPSRRSSIAPVCQRRGRKTPKKNKKHRKQTKCRVLPRGWHKKENVQGGGWRGGGGGPPPRPPSTAPPAQTPRPGAHPGRRAPILQVDQPAPGGCRPHPPPDRAPQQPESVGHRRHPVRGDLLGLHLDRGQLLALGRPAVEQEPDAPGAAWARPAEVHARQPAVAHIDAPLLANLALARLPRRLAVRLHDTPGNR